MSRRTKEDIAGITYKLRKLAKLIPDATTGNVSRGSILMELEQRDDRASLVGKVRVMVDRAEQVIYSAINAVEIGRK